MAGPASGAARVRLPHWPLPSDYTSRSGRAFEQLPVGVPIGDVAAGVRAYRRISDNSVGRALLGLGVEPLGSSRNNSTLLSREPLRTSSFPYRSAKPRSACRRTADHRASTVLDWLRRSPRPTGRLPSAVRAWVRFAPRKTRRERRANPQLECFSPSDQTRTTGTTPIHRFPPEHKPSPPKAGAQSLPLGLNRGAAIPASGPGFPLSRE